MAQTLLIFGILFVTLLFYKTGIARKRPATIRYLCPFRKHLEIGKTYTWCACGKSADVFCDSTLRKLTRDATTFTTLSNTDSSHHFYSLNFRVFEFLSFLFLLICFYLFFLQNRVALMTSHPWNFPSQKQ